MLHIHIFYAYIKNIHIYIYIEHIYMFTCIYTHLGWEKANLGAPIYKHTYTNIYDFLAFLGALYLTVSITD